MPLPLLDNGPSIVSTESQLAWDEGRHIVEELEPGGVAVRGPAASLAGRVPGLVSQWHQVDADAYGKGDVAALPGRVGRLKTSFSRGAAARCRLAQIVL